MVMIVAVYISPTLNSGVRVRSVRVFLIWVGLFNENIRNKIDGGTTSPYIKFHSHNIRYNH